MRHAHLISCVALVAATVLSGCRSDQTAAQNGTNNDNTSPSKSTSYAHLTVPSGTSIEVTLNTALTSKTANVGDTWSGSVRNPVSLDGRNVIPAGSSVTGTVSGALAAERGNRAMLDLALTTVTVGEHAYTVHGGMESIIAGSPRARNLGAIGAATAAGAIIGHAIGGSGKGTLIGAVVGGGAATGVVAHSDGYQVVLKPGTDLRFTTSEAVAVRQ